MMKYVVKALRRLGLIELLTNGDRKRMWENIKRRLKRNDYNHTRDCTDCKNELAEKFQVPPEEMQKALEENE